ncbi:magnesium-dependent phosphatase-1 [Dichotomocladium elegans]|nr:magnesium-dependent phosphatase-1 [Dichotomocladium elegans]
MTIVKDISTLPTRLPKMIAFDLDYTVWEEWIDCTSGPPFAYDHERNVILDRHGYEIVLFKEITAVFSFIINSMPGTKIAIASRSTTPDWCYTALRMLRIPQVGKTIHGCVDYFEIYPTSKITHFKALSKKSGIDCGEMVFFDDEWRNSEVRTLGVHFHRVDTKKGVTMDVLMGALREYDQNSDYGSWPHLSKSP